ncbi:hypothetical protein, partial [Pseudomonas syringae group genomosp. 3]|uniref:hypothetical protein n=1 Tax=Pseudomonas syringae group genomosp. 3 TaxID=251701 RepID=UPI001F47638C
STLAKNHDDHPLSPAGRLRLGQLHHFQGHDRSGRSASDLECAAQIYGMEHNTAVLRCQLDMFTAQGTFSPLGD